jgi:hypothetical protein
MRKDAFLVFSVFARFSLDSARTRIPTAKMAASQKINRAALDIFILFGPFSLRQHRGFRCVETQLTLSAQYPDFAQTVANNASRIFNQTKKRSAYR